MNIKSLSIAIGLVAVGAPAWACECYAPEPKQQIEKTAIIAHSNILDARLLSQSEMDVLFSDYDHSIFDQAAVATVLIERPIKGAKKDQKLTVYFDVSGTDCSMPASVGDSRVRFIDNFDGKYWVFLCSQERFWGRDDHDTYIDEFERITGENWNRWRYKEN